MPPLWQVLRILEISNTSFMSLDDDALVLVDAKLMELLVLVLVLVLLLLLTLRGELMLELGPEMTALG